MAISWLTRLLSNDETLRPQDRQDTLALLRKSSDEDRQLAREATDLIIARSFQRGRHLVAKLQMFFDMATEFRRKYPDAT